MKLFVVVFLMLGLTSSLLSAQDFDDDDMDIEDVDDYDEVDSQDTLNVPKEERPVYKPPTTKGAYFHDAFVSEDSFKKKWVVSKARKDDADEDIAKYDGKWSVEEPTDNPLQNDLGLVLKSRAKHHAISAKLNKPFKFDGKPLVVQYEVKFQNGQECGGAYIKLLTEAPKLDLSNFYDKTPFTIMFGPDKCGNDDKLHFILRHKNPVKGTFEEKHAKKTTASLGSFFTDKRTHLYTLVVKPDNTFEVYIDQDLVNSGSLLEDVQPPINPPATIADPDDKKPEDWDDREKIKDPYAEKPEDWDETQPEYMEDSSAVKPDGWLDDETEFVPDPDALKPEDWDEDMDGEWEAPMINNPACESAPGCGEWNAPQIKNPLYKGKWSAPMIDNPDYKGKWAPRMIDNPDYFEDKEPYKMSPIGAIGLELWSMSDDILFDNFLVTDSKDAADDWAAQTFELKIQQELAAAGGKSVVDAVMDITNERPWVWAIILLVVVLPIVLLIAYCCSGGSSKIRGWFRWLWESAEERKWLFAVYVAIILIPGLIASVWICPGKGPTRLRKELKTDEAAERKKTDTPSPDSKEEDDKEEGEETEDKEEIKEDSSETKPDEAGDAPPAQPKGSPKKTAPKKPTKSDLETEEDQEADAEDDEENAEESAAPETRSSPRKRKTRKD